MTDLTSSGGGRKGEGEKGREGAVAEPVEATTAAPVEATAAATVEATAISSADEPSQSLQLATGASGTFRYDRGA
jgi:hypothetical protein